MMRGWIIAPALVCFTAAPLLAQQPVANRYAQRPVPAAPQGVAPQQAAPQRMAPRQQPQPLRTAPAPQQQVAVAQQQAGAPRYHVDPMVQQAAVANPNSR